MPKFYDMKKYSALIISTFLSCLALSQTDTIKLNEIEVNANRINSRYNEQLRIVQIINKEELRQLPSLSLTEILDYTGNVDVRQRGVHNVQSDISIRGGNYEQTLIMVNGVPVNDPQTGHHNMNIPINTEQIERIEILSGGDARQFGANAFAGVINIVTTVPSSKSFSLKLTGGDYTYFGGDATASFRTAGVSHQIGISRHQSGGCRPNTDFAHNQLSWQVQQSSEKRTTHLLLAAEDKAFGAMSFYTPKFPNQYEQTKTFFASTTNKYFISKHTWTTQGYYRQHHDRFELFRHSLPANQIPAWYKNHNYHMTQVAGGQSYIALNTAYGTTTIGTDFRYEHIFSNVLGENMNDTITAPFEEKGFFTKEAKKYIQSLFFDHRLTANKWQWAAGAMVTTVNYQHVYFYPGTEIGYQIRPNIKIFASASRSLRMPSYTELYYKDAAHQGNSSLQPEEANQFEFGLKNLSNQIWQIQTAGFYRQGKNIIDWVRITETDKWRSENITTVNSYGFESNISFSPLSEKTRNLIHKVQLSYGYNQILKLSGQYYSKYALDVLRHKISLTSVHKLNKNILFSWNILYHERMGTYTEFPTGKERKYKPYLTLDAQLTYAYKTSKFFIQGSNLLNTYYYDFGNIPMPGRWVKGGILLEWK